MANPIDTIPPQVTMATTETLPWRFDTSPLLAAGQTPSAPAAALTDETNGRPVPLADLPSVVGPNITQEVRGSALTAGHTYRLDVTFQAAAATIWTMSLQIIVPQ